MVRIIGVIPARYSSTRLPGKPLADICGKPMIQHVYERCKKSTLLTDLIVATDDNRIKEVTESFGGKAIMTSPDHCCGSDRVREIASKLNLENDDIVLNIQGDEPLIESHIIDSIIQGIKNHPEVHMVTAASKTNNKEEIEDENTSKVVLDKDNYALYFSRHPVPFIKKQEHDTHAYIQIGIYGFRKHFLDKFSSLPKTRLELAESLEHLRALEHGHKIKVVEVDFKGLGVDTIADLEKVKNLIRKQNQ
jgi:3-deoxy-manno-octulosonate cytidylyltransferase (CMP-KDO synthetase)